MQAAKNTNNESVSAAPPSTVAVVATAAPAAQPSATVKSLSEAQRYYEDKDFFTYVDSLKPEVLLEQLKRESLKTILGYGPRYSVERVNYLIKDKAVLGQLLDDQKSKGRLSYNTHDPHLSAFLSRFSSSPELLARLFHLCDSDSFTCLHLRYDSQTERKILDFVLHAESWQNPALRDSDNSPHLISRWLAGSINQPYLTTEFFKKAWLEGEKFSPILKESLLEYTFTGNPELSDSLDMAMHEWLKQEMTVVPAADAKDQKSSAPVTVTAPNVIHTSKKTPINLSTLESEFPKICALIWKEGLLQWMDFRRLSQAASTSPSLKALKAGKDFARFWLMSDAEILLTGSQVPMEVFDKVIAAHKAISHNQKPVDLLRAMNISLKTMKGTVLNPYVTPEDWFMETLWQEGASLNDVTAFVTSHHGLSKTLAKQLNAFRQDIYAIFAAKHEDPAWFNMWRTGKAEQAVEARIKAQWGFFSRRPKYADEMLAKLELYSKNPATALNERFKTLTSIIDRASSPIAHPSFGRSAKTQVFYNDLKRDFFTPASTNVVDSVVGTGAGPGVSPK